MKVCRYWPCTPCGHCALRAVRVCAVGINHPAGSSSISADSSPCRHGNWDIADDLRYRRPLRHAFTAGEIGELDASLRDIPLKVGQSVRAILIELALNVIFHGSPKCTQLKRWPVLSFSTMQISTMAQTHDTMLRMPSVNTVRHSCPTARPVYPA